MSLKNPANMDPFADRPLTESDFDFFRGLIRAIAGISMADGKLDLVRIRLKDRLLALGISSFGEYRALLSSLPNGHPEFQSFINLLTTNKTDFFREAAHFDYLASYFLPRWLQRHSGGLKVWCSASSTGEEPYSLAMFFAKLLPAGRDFSIWATDIDTSVLSTASNGVYPLEKIATIPEGFRFGAVEMGKEGVADWFRINGKVKEKVTFARYNLTEPSLPREQDFDLIFCRNVLIYFSRDTIDRVAEKFWSVSKPDSLLVIGHSDSKPSASTGWKATESSLFLRS